LAASEHFGLFGIRSPSGLSRGTDGRPQYPDRRDGNLVAHLNKHDVSRHIPSKLFEYLRETRHEEGLVADNSILKKPPVLWAF
jgi:hypothetical protein